DLCFVQALEREPGSDDGIVEERRIVQQHDSGESRVSVDARDHENAAPIVERVLRENDKSIIDDGFVLPVESAPLPSGGERLSLPEIQERRGREPSLSEAEAETV